MFAKITSITHAPTFTRNPNLNTIVKKIRVKMHPLVVTGR